MFSYDKKVEKCLKVFNKTVSDLEGLLLSVSDDMDRKKTIIRETQEDVVHLEGTKENIKNKISKIKQIIE